MQPDNFTSESLLDKAMTMLNESYDSDRDSFFVVVTKDGKDPTMIVGDQAIIGEINLKTIVAFIVAVVSQLCESMGGNPYVFVTRHILAFFIDQERQSFYDLVAGQGGAGEEAANTGDVKALLADLFDTDQDEDEELFGEVEGEEPEQKSYFIVNPGMSEIDN